MHKFKVLRLRSMMIIFAVVLCVCILFSSICFLESAKPTATMSYPARRVVIDAGHGGFDGGCIGYSGSLEKDINLAISKKLGDMLSLFGFEVEMTRDDDSDTATKGRSDVKKSDIHNRVNIIDKHSDTIAISIHQNEYKDRSVKGAQVFYGVKNPQSETLAKSIQDSLRDILDNENQRQIKKGDSSIYILKNTTAPIALVECGFLSNPNEEALLKTDAYQSKVAFAITCGLIQQW